MVVRQLQGFVCSATSPCVHAANGDHPKRARFQGNNTEQTAFPHDFAASVALGINIDAAPQRRLPLRSQDILAVPALIKEDTTVEKATRGCSGGVGTSGGGGSGGWGGGGGGVGGWGSWDGSSILGGSAGGSRVAGCIATSPAALVSSGCGGGDGGWGGWGNRYESTAGASAAGVWSSRDGGGANAADASAAGPSALSGGVGVRLAFAEAAQPTEVPWSTPKAKAMTEVAPDSPSYSPQASPEAEAGPESPSYSPQTSPEAEASL